MIDVVFSFDTTSSMTSCLGNVRRRLDEATDRLKAAIPGINIGLIAHGDSMNPHDYVIKVCDLTDDYRRLTNFIRDSGDNAGGGPHANYERVLNVARTLNWRAGKPRALVMVGDEVPHSPSFRYADGKSFDWRNELKLLLELQVKVHGVHCLPGVRPSSRLFYQEIATETGGFYLTLEQFADVMDLIQAICYREASPVAFSQYEQEVRARSGFSRSLDGIFAGLGGRARAPINIGKKRTDSRGRKLEPVPVGRFQLLHVGPRDVTIKDFVQDQGLKFQTGRGFYEFTKTETIQASKEIVLQDKQSEDLYSGDEARSILGLGNVTARIKPADLDQFSVFVQSTSYNRRLKAGTRFLYELDGWRGR